MLFSAVFTLGPPPSPRSMAPSNSGVLVWQKEQISIYTLRVLYHRGALDWWTPHWHTPPNSSMGGHGGMGSWVGAWGGRWGGEMVDGGLGQELRTRLVLEKEVRQNSGGAGVRVGVPPWMKMRSVFGTCMVSGIRRREKVREWDRRSSREEEGGALSDGSTGFCWGRWPSQREEWRRDAVEQSFRTRIYCDFNKNIMSEMFWTWTQEVLTSNQKWELCASEKHHLLSSVYVHLSEALQSHLTLKLTETADR